MCNHAKAVEKCLKPILDLGNSEGSPCVEDGVYHSVNDVVFQPFVHGPYEENAEFCQEFILLYGLHKRVVDNKVVAYYKNVEDGGEEDVVIFDDSGLRVLKRL